MKAIIISAADANFWPLLSGMLHSIEEPSRRDGISVGVLDIGLTPKQRDRLRQYGAKVVAPDWDYPLTHFAKPAANVFKAQTARPQLRRYFPGYDAYVWLDADCWVQDWQVIGSMLSAMDNTKFAISPEIHPAYLPTLQSTSFEWLYFFKRVKNSFGAEVGRTVLESPVLNSGVFAASADAPHWSAWDRHLADALKRLDESFFYVEQLALNVAIQQENLPVSSLPARFNWICYKALPFATPDGQTLVEPIPPYRPLGIIHLVGEVKKHDQFPIKDSAGNVHRRALRYPELPM
jgi:lipopolysaccharide biosynthesis glycosyltransferase